MFIETSTFICRGCSKDFCIDHLLEHRQALNEQYVGIQNDYNQFRQELNEQKANPKKRLLIQDIDRWEKHAIQEIQRTAEECRQKLLKYTDKFIIKIENELNETIDPPKLSSEKNKPNELNEVGLDRLKEKLRKLQGKLDKPPNVLIKEKSTSFLNKIFVIVPSRIDTKWKQFGITITGGKENQEQLIGRNDHGNQINQLEFPYSIFLDDDETIYITDWGNHRIVEWKSDAKESEIVAGGNGEGDQTDQLNHPIDVIIDKEKDSLIISDQGNRRVMRCTRQNNTDGEIFISDIDCSCLTMDKDGSLYVSDWKQNEVRRWKRGDKDGTIVAGGNGKGDQLNQFNRPTSIFIDEDYSLYVSDMDNHRVMKWLKDAKIGIIVAGGNGEGNSLAQLSLPRGIIVDQLGQIYVADGKNHRAMCWCPGAKEGTIVAGGNGQGVKLNQFNELRSLSFDQEGNLYVVDSDNHRIQKFEIDEN